MKDSKKSYLALKGERNYWLYLITCVFTRFGDSVDSLAVSWIAYQLTGSPVWLTVIIGVNALPTVFLTPLIAPLVERMNKKRVMVVTGLLRALITGAVGILMAVGLLTAPLLLLATLLISTAESFADPAYMASVPRIIPAEKMDAGLALRSAVSQAAQLIGTGVGGAVLALIGGGGALVIDGALFLLSTVFVSFLHLQKSDAKEGAQKPASRYLDTLKEGFSYFAKRAALVFLALGGVVLNILLSPMGQLMTAYVVDVLHMDAYALSVAGLGNSVGMLAGSVLYPLLQKRITLKRLVLFTGGVIVLNYAGLSLLGLVTGQLLIKYGALFVLQFALTLFIAFFSVMTNVLFFKVIEESYLSRMASIFNSLGMLAVPLASVFSGALVSILSVQTVYLVTAAITLVITLLLPRMRAFAALEQVAAQSQKEENTHEASL